MALFSEVKRAVPKAFLGPVLPHYSVLTFTVSLWLGMSLTENAQQSLGVLTQGLTFHVPH